jgi:DNA-directed RNA polymerase specialized sigma24 family protein
MLDQQRFATRAEDQRQELFIERYERLLAWALSLTNHHHASAEDLVQDAFIQFTRGRTSLETIANVDGYLRRMLRYMHLARVTRNTSQLSYDSISIVEYDSFNLGWRSIEIQQRMQAQEELGQICSYACIRKESSRAGGVLILRFFHEYLPTEIAKILCRSRHCVDEWQRLARSEAKLYLEDPQRLKFVGSKPFVNSFRINLSRSDVDLITELRHLIFSSCQGNCSSPDELYEIYQIGITEKLTTARFGHIVSCRRCLDNINRILGLPLLAERYQSEIQSGTKPPSDMDGNDSSGGSATDVRVTLEQRLREVVEDQPQELRILVNGRSVSSLKVNSEPCELTLEGLDHVHVVQILNEQDATLLFLSASDLIGSTTKQWAQIELSQNRSLKVILSGTTLSIRYHATPVGSVELFPQARVRPFGRRPEFTTEPVQGPWGLPLRRLVANLGSQITRITRRLLSDSSLLPLRKETECVLSHHEALTRKPLWSRPEFITILVSFLLIGTVLLLKLNTNPSITTTKLLDQARNTEQAEYAKHVVHRVIEIQEREFTGGVIVSRRKIEVWEDLARGERDDRIYDADNRLIARRLQSRAGSGVVYHHQVGLQDVNRKGWLLTPEELWALEPTARNFLAIATNGQGLTIEERPSNYIVSLADERIVGNARLVKVTLTLGRKDLRTKEQTVLIEGNGEIREYRFIEVSFDHFQRKDIDATIFAPEPVATFSPSIKTDRFRRSSRANRERTLRMRASQELEVEVAYLLNQAKGDRNEQITLVRDANGLLRVEGIVDTPSRKAELMRDLAPLTNNPAVKVDIRAISETLLLPGTSKTGTTLGPLTNTTNTTDVIPVDHELRELLSRRQYDKDHLDEAIRSFASRNVNRSYRALFHAIELKQLVDRFSQMDMHSVTPQARAKWLEMVRGHAAAFEREWKALNQEVQPIFLVIDAESEAGMEAQISTDADLAHGTQRLHRLALLTADGIRRAFTTSVESTNLSIKSKEFWSSVIDAKNLAARISKYRAQ